MASAFISLGSNIAPEKNLRYSVGRLRDAFGELRTSPVYQSAAIGFTGADFLNAAVGFESSVSVGEIADILVRIENECLRDRNQPRFSSRTLDLDLLLYGEMLVKTDQLTLPRPEILDQAFVLQPLADIAGGITHPETGLTIAEHWRRFQTDAGQVEPVMIRQALAL